MLADATIEIAALGIETTYSAREAAACLKGATPGLISGCTEMSLCGLTVAKYSRYGRLRVPVFFDRDAQRHRDVLLSAPLVLIR